MVANTSLARGPIAPRLKTALVTTFKIAFAATLILFLVKSGHLDPRGLAGLLTPGNVAVALGLIGASTYLAAWRWILLLRARGLEMTSGYGVALYLIGIFFNHALPGSVGGDVVRGYYLAADYPQNRLDAILSVLIDRVLGLYSFFVIALAAIALDARFIFADATLRALALFDLSLFAAMTAFFVVVFSKKLTAALGLKFVAARVPALGKVIEGCHAFGRTPWTLVNSVVISVAAQLIVAGFFFAVARAMGESVPIPAILFAMPMGFLVTALPISPAGVGVGQVAFLYLFKAYLGRDTAFGAVSITAFQLALLAWGLVGALLYLGRRRPA